MSKSDFLIICTAADFIAANKLRETLHQWGYSGTIFNGESVHLNTKLDSVKRVLLCISSNIDADFIACKINVTRRWFRTGRAFRINPVHLEQNVSFESRWQGHILGLSSFNNFYVWYKTFEIDVAKEFKR